MVFAVTSACKLICAHRPVQFMVYPHMLPSKSPSSQSPFILPTPSNHPAAQVIQQQQSITAGNDSPADTSKTGAPPRGSPDGNESAMNVDRSSSGVDQPPSSSSNTRPPSTSTAQQQQQQQQRTGPPIHRGVERYKPRIFGFPVHEVAVLHRWQERVAEQMVTGAGQAHGQAQSQSAAATQPQASSARREAAGASTSQQQAR